MKDANVRNAHYAARCTAALMTPVVAAVNTLQKANFAARTRVLYVKQQNTVQVLDGAGVPTTDYPYYLAFSAKIGKYWLSSSGESLAMACANEIALYVARGLLQPVLQEIRTDVYSVNAPIGG